MGVVEKTKCDKEEERGGGKGSGDVDDDREGGGEQISSEERKPGRNRQKQVVVWGQKEVDKETEYSRLPRVICRFILSQLSFFHSWPCMYIVVFVYWIRTSCNTRPARQTWLE